MSSGNVHRINIDGKEIILVGTAHVSRQSAEEVKTLIEEEQPDSVAVELCQSRYQSITDKDRWESMDIFKVIKEGKAPLLLVNLLMSSYQKKLAEQFNIQPGQEMIQGIISAQEIGANLVLADRDIQTTFKRLWHGVGFFGKIKLLFELILSIFSEDEISEEELEKMKTEDMLTSALQELSHSFPDLKKILIDERDKYLAKKIKDAPGDKVLAVLGAGHVPGIKEELFKEQNLDSLVRLPDKKGSAKLISWGIPLIIIGIIASTFFANQETGINQMISWILWNGSLSALGTIIALGHPLSILTAFLVAPISSLSPFLAAGWFAGLTEAYVRKPSIQDFENLSDDVKTLKGFWKNKVTHILLVVVFANIGSSIGTFVGGADVVKQFIDTFF
ncbi:MAG: TraB/GumN family protein [Clostridia bacterium]|nr:TraB/GumN family protein [Clostridia bacterium]